MFVLTQDNIKYANTINTVDLEKHLKVLASDSLEGRDVKIMAPVQTSNPENYGGKTYEVAFGVNRLLQMGSGNSLGLELVVPVEQKLNGPQMEIENSLNLVFRKSF